MKFYLRMAISGSEVGSRHQACVALAKVIYELYHPNMEDLQIQLWRQADPTRKMNMLAQLNQAARLLALAGLRARYPEATESELRRKLADLLLGEELARKVYGESFDAK